MEPKAATITHECGFGRWPRGATSTIGGRRPNGHSRFDPTLAGMYDSAIIAFALFALGASIGWKFL